MFDVAPTELLAVAIVALLVIGPKDLPKAMRVVGHWVGRARGVARQFRSGFDAMVRESELADMEKQWAEENKRIMSEHGAGESTDKTQVDPVPSTADVDVMEPTPASEPDLFTQPVMVDKPVVAAAPAGTTPAADAKADS